MGIQIDEDRLSDLPDSIILHILSFLETKEALQTFILSKRWKNIPKHLPTLIFKSTHFNYLHSFGKFVSRILSLRDHSTDLHILDLELEAFHDGFVEPDILKSIVEYAVSHNIRQLRISVTCDIQQVPSYFFSSETLTCLDLDVLPCWGRLLFPNSLTLPALTTLALRTFHFCAGDDGCAAAPFSAFNKLETLLIEDCLLLDAQILCISSTTLVNLTVNYGFGNTCFDSYKCNLSTPSLCNLNYTGVLIQILCRSDLSSLKHVSIDVFSPYSSPYKEYYPFVLNLILDLSNIKSLTVSSTTLQVLFYVPNLFKVKLASLYNLESLQVKVKPLRSPTFWNLTGSESFDFDKFEPDRIVDFLLQNSPSAKVINI